jgi:hypothetical protein
LRGTSCGTAVVPQFPGRVTNEFIRASLERMADLLDLVGNTFKHTSRLGTLPVAKNLANRALLASLARVWPADSHRQFICTVMKDAPFSFQRLKRRTTDGAATSKSRH